MSPLYVILYAMHSCCNRAYSYKTYCIYDSVPFSQLRVREGDGRWKLTAAPKSEREPRLPVEFLAHILIYRDVNEIYCSHIWIVFIRKCISFHFNWEIVVFRFSLNVSSRSRHSTRRFSSCIYKYIISIYYFPCMLYICCMVTGSMLQHCYWLWCIHGK